MTGSGKVTRRRFGRPGRARIVLMTAAAIVGLAVVGVTLSAGAGAGVTRPGLAKPVVGGAGPLRPDSPNPAAQQCFISSASCSSADPTVAFTMFSSNDSSGCVFTQDTSWGDKTPDTILTYVGAPDKTPLATFTHAYPKPGTFTINYTITVTDNPNGNCTGASGQLGFTLLAPPKLACQLSQVTVPAATVPVSVSNEPVNVTFGPMPLTFRPGTATKPEQCALQPAAGVLPVDLKIPNVARPIRLGQTDATATIDLFPASSIASAVPDCDFSSLEALTNPSFTPPLGDFAHTNNCLLTPTFHASWDVVARWTVPGIVQMAHVQATNSDTVIYTTQPLTYYVDLDTMPLPQGFNGDTISVLADFIYSTLAENVPVLDRIAFVQDPSAHLLVTNPVGRQIGIARRNKSHSFAGAGYAEVKGRSVAWILEPVRGRYGVTVRALAGSRFQVDVADLQFLGHGTAPLVENFTWKGRLGRRGVARRRFTVRGTALAPTVTPHASATRVKPQTRVTFTLNGSVITLGTAKVLWQFGDGTSAVGQPAEHRYRKAGQYTPTVTVTDVVGDTVTVTMPAIVVQS